MPAGRVQLDDWFEVVTGRDWQHDLLECEPLGDGHLLV